MKNVFCPQGLWGIVHFLAKPKPWEKGYFGFYGQEYRSYRKELQKKEKVRQ